jgi:4-hydroxy-4-methyl-2-oxoglutarate aldolase
VSAATGGLAGRLAALGVATVYEAAGKRGLLDADYVALRPGTSVCGPARVAACAQDDNLAVHAVVERIVPGDVVVLAMPVARPVALLGELLATQVAHRGAAAVLVDAAVRDSRVLRADGSLPPVWARWVRAAGAAKAAMVGVDVPVEVAGCRIEPGDLVVLDDDGVAVVGAAEAATVAEAAEARERKEDAMRRRLLAGELSYDIHGLRPR